MEIENENYTTFFDNKTFRKELKRSVDKLKQKILLTDKLFSESMVSLEKDSYHAITRFLVGETKTDKILYSHIFKAALQSEKLSAGSSFISVLTSIAFVENLLKDDGYLSGNDYQHMEDYHSRSMELHKKLTNNCQPFTSDHVGYFIDNIAKDPKLVSAIKESVLLSGIEGVIQIENGHSDNYTVELRNGYHFPVRIFKSFLGSFGTWNQNETKIFLVDGIIEKVSEIDKILMKSFETKIPLVIVAQGFGDEVLGTLKINYDSKKLNVLPVVVGGDLESLNIMNDIAIATGSKVLSTLSGDMIVYAKYEELPFVDNILCNESGMLIQHSKNEADVAQQINSLINRKTSNEVIIDIGLLFDKRISNLLSNTVTLYLPETSQMENETIRTKIDICLRTIKTLNSHGFISKSDLKNLIIDQDLQDPIVKSINSTIKLIEEHSTKDKFPSLSIALGTYLTGKSIFQLLCCGGIVGFEN